MFQPSTSNKCQLNLGVEIKFKICWGWGAVEGLTVGRAFSGHPADLSPTLRVFANEGSTGMGPKKDSLGLLIYL